MNARLIFCNIPTSHQHRRSVNFYNHLFGRQLARSMSDEVQSHHAPVAAGVQLALTPRHSENEHPTLYFAVDHLDKAVAELRDLGATLVRDRIRLPIPKGAVGAMGAAGCKLNQVDMGDPPFDMAVAALVRDPDGNMIGLIQLAKFATHWFPGGVSAEQATAHEHGLAAAEKYFATR